MYIYGPKEEWLEREPVYNKELAEFLKENPHLIKKRTRRKMKQNYEPNNLIITGFICLILGYSWATIAHKGFYEPQLTQYKQEQETASYKAFSKCADKAQVVEFESCIAFEKKLGKF